MKKFSNFLNESRAAQQATRMGLVSDGHGNYYNRFTKEFIAKNVGGQLSFYNKGQKPGKDREQSPLEKRYSYSTYEQVDPNQVPMDQQVPVDPNQMPMDQQPLVPVEVQRKKGTLTVAFGRFNPPTVGHQKLLDMAAMSSNGEDYIVVPSRIQDSKMNPLDVDTKISFMRAMFPEHAERIINDVNNVSIFDVLKKAYVDGYSNIQIVSGSDRVSELENLANNYNGQFYQFDNIAVLSAGDRDPDSESSDGSSSSKMRIAAAEGDLDTFIQGLPQEMDENIAIDLFNVLRQSMNIKEGWEVWEIAPKFDWKNLRENYINENIFKLGEKVQNLNTGLVGRIVRRGTNYLICVTESGMMFKSWIKDLMEYTEKKMDSMYRLPGKPNTLVGTTGFLKFASAQTKGSECGKENLAYGQENFGLNFINKYRKK
jgi:hypothetical protein